MAKDVKLDGDQCNLVDFKIPFRLTIEVELTCSSNNSDLPITAEFSLRYKGTHLWRKKNGWVHYKIQSLEFIKV